MFIDTAKNTMRIAALKEGITSDGTHYILNMRRDTSMFYLENNEVIPSDENYNDASQFLSDITELDISSKQARSILSLYPQVRIKMAIYDGIEDTDVRDGLGFSAAHFFLGCQWPTFDDELDAHTFVDLLKKQALLMGFRTKKKAA